MTKEYALQSSRRGAYDSAGPTPVWNIWRTRCRRSACPPRPGCLDSGSAPPDPLGRCVSGCASAELLPSVRSTVEVGDTNPVNDAGCINVNSYPDRKWMYRTSNYLFTVLLPLCICHTLTNPSSNKETMNWANLIRNLVRNQTIGHSHNHPKKLRT